MANTQANAEDWQRMLETTKREALETTAPRWKRDTVGMVGEICNFYGRRVDVVRAKARTNIPGYF